MLNCNQLMQFCGYLCFSKSKSNMALSVKVQIMFTFTNPKWLTFSHIMIFSNCQVLHELTTQQTTVAFHSAQCTCVRSQNTQGPCTVITQCQHAHSQPHSSLNATTNSHLQFGFATKTCEKQNQLQIVNFFLAFGGKA